LTLRNFGDAGVIGSDEAIFPVIILVEVLLLLLHFPGAAIREAVGCQSWSALKKPTFMRVRVTGI
jgi:hypothetical protein